MKRRASLGFISLFSFVFLLTFSGCGGGTSGSGGVTIDGTVKDTNNIAIGTAIVTLLESGQSTETAFDGSFTLEVNGVFETYTLLLTAENVFPETTFTIDGDGVTEGSRFSVDLRVERETGSVESTGLGIVDSGGAEVTTEQSEAINEANEPPASSEPAPEGGSGGEGSGGSGFDEPTNGVGDTAGGGSKPPSNPPNTGTGTTPGGGSGTKPTPGK